MYATYSVDELLEFYSVDEYMWLTFIKYTQITDYTEQNDFKTQHCEYQNPDLNQIYG